MEVELVRHPASPVQPVDSIRVKIDRDAQGRVDLSYRLSGDVGVLSLSPLMAAQRADNLWQTTCFEAFARRVGGVRYAEFNFSPSTCWAAYIFQDYRVMAGDLDFARMPRVDIRMERSVLDLSVTLDLANAPSDWGETDLLWGLSAVIETLDRQKSYWAIAHPPGDPDFHHGDCFAARLRAPGTA